MASRPAPRNRNDRALGLARVRAAARPAPGIVRKDEIERQAWAAGLVQNEMGVWYDPTKTPAQKKIETAVNFLPMAALTDAASGVYNLLTTDYNPENIKYPTRMVRAGARGGGMVSGGQPNISDTIMGLGAAIKSSVEATPITEFDKARYEKNPLSFRGSNLILTPEQKSERSVQVMNADREKEYSNLLRTLKAAGITEEEMYRDVVVGPDGQVNFNANVQAMIAQLGNAADALRGTELIGYGLGKPVAAAARAGARAATRSVIPRAVSVATNPRLINAGQATLETLQRGGRPSEAVLGGVAALVVGNKPVSTGALRLTPEQHGLLVSEGLDAKAPRGGNRGLAATLASNVQSALRRPPAGSGGKRVPVGEMKVKFTAEDAVRIAQENPEIMKNNAAYIDLYRASPQGSNKPGSIFVHAHPPGMNPSEVRNVLPDHLTSGPLNDLETKVNGARRADGIDPLTNYTDIVTEGIALAKNGKFKEGTWNAKLADMTLEEAKIYLGGNGVKYW